MKIQCAKKFNSLDSMISDMENALDEAEVHSSEDITAAEDDEEEFTLKDANTLAWDIISDIWFNAEEYGLETLDKYNEYTDEYQDDIDAMDMIDNCLYDILDQLIALRV